MRKSLNVPVTLCCLAWLGGCVVPVPKGYNPFELRFMSREELREYTEEVFRRHNRVMSRLMMAPLEVESLTTAQSARLERAEQRMNKACANLNTIASARARNEDTGFWLENRVRQTVRLCDAETTRLEKLLDELEISR